MYLRIMSYTIDWLINTYMGFFKEYGMAEDNIREEFEAWKNKTQRDDVKDFLWYVFQQMVLIIPQQTFPHTEQQHRLLKNVYFKMWELRRIFEGKKANHIMKLKLFHEIKANYFQASTPLKVEVISGGCCPFCDSLDGKLYSFEEVLKEQPLASSRCTQKSGCTCTYAFVPQRDANGRLILD
jgi:hypothetical protein